MIYRVGKAAQRLGIHPSTLRDLKNRGLIEVKRDYLGWRFFLEEDLRELEEKLFPSNGSKPLLRRKKGAGTLN
jgi:DNA-binding transcriptional MerR regulator